VSLYLPDSCVETDVDYSLSRSTDRDNQRGSSWRYVGQTCIGYETDWKHNTAV